MDITYVKDTLKNKLKGKIVERGMTVEEVAKSMGINKASLYRKLRNPETITVVDMAKIKEALNLTAEEFIEIFLIH